MLYLTLMVIVVLIVLTILVWIWCGVILSINPLFVFYIWINELILGKAPENCEVLRYSKMRLRAVSIRKLIKRFQVGGNITQEQADTWNKEINEVMSPYASYVKGKLSFSDYVRIEKILDDIELHVSGEKRS